MLRLSSNWTLVFKIAVPAIYISFFGMLILAIFVTDKEISPLNLPVVKYSALAIYLSVIALMYFTIMRLRRVEFSEGKLIVSNYFKTFQYDMQDVKSLKFFNIGLFNIGAFTLKSKGVWGKKIFFFAKNINVQTLLTHYPSLK